MKMLAYLQRKARVTKYSSCMSDEAGPFLAASVLLIHHALRAISLVVIDE